jgi:hypothetical protein
MTTFAYVASHAAGSTHRRQDTRIVSVLAEYGYGAYLAPEGDDAGVTADRLAHLAEADVVVCDLVWPDHDLPVEVAIASARSIPVLALVPADVIVHAWVDDLLCGCGATIIRYERAEPHQALDARLAELELQHEHGALATAA